MQEQTQNKYREISNEEKKYKNKNRFDNKVFVKRIYRCSKCPIYINKVNVKKILVPNELFCTEKGFRYFIGLKCGEKIWPLCIKPQKDEWICKTI